MSNFISIKEIIKGDKIKISYKEEGSESDEMFFKTLIVSEINVDEKYVITEDGSKIYGKYAHNAYFNIIK